MRAHQFIVEYRRDKTAQSMGDKLLTALANTHPSATPSRLYNAQTLLAMARTPEKFPEKTISLDILDNDQVKINPENAEQIVQQIKPQIIDAILAYIESTDPTRNKQFTQWMARAWANANGQWPLEYLNRYNQLGIYELAKRYRIIPPEAADINKFRTYGDFEDWMKANRIDELLADAETEQKLDKGKAEKIYEDGQVTVLIPTDQAGACKYGRNTKWCTAATKGHNHFEYYNGKGPLYILIPKNPSHEGEKYQLHFPKGEFTDERNERVALDYVLKQRFPELIPLFIEREPEIQGYIVFAPDELLAGLGKIMGGLLLDNVSEEVSDWESDDDSWSEWRSDQAIERGYVDDEGDIDWDRVYQDNDLNDYIDFNYDARKFYYNAEQIANLSPRIIKRLASESIRESDSEIGEPSVSNLDEVYAWIIKDKLDDAGHYIAKFFRDRVVVSPSKEYNEKYSGRKIGEVGDWTVSIVSGSGGR